MKNYERVYRSSFGSLVLRKEGTKVTTLTEHEDRRIDDLASRRGELLAAIIFLIFVIERNWGSRRNPRVKYPRLDRKEITTERGRGDLGRALVVDLGVSRRVA